MASDTPADVPIGTRELRLISEAIGDLRTAPSRLLDAKVVLLRLWKVAYADGRTEERDACARLAGQHNAQCHHPDGSGGDFADVIRGRNAETPDDA